MAKTFTAPFAQTTKTSTAVATAAVGNLGTDAPTGTVLLATAGAEGALLTRLWAMPRGAAVANSALLFISKDGGTTQRLIDSEALPSYSTSTSTAIAETAFSNYTESSPLRMEAGDRLYVAIQAALATGFVFRAEWTDF